MLHSKYGEVFMSLRCSFHGLNHSLGLIVVSLKQTIPPNGTQVCPGGPLIYECVTLLGSIIWLEEGSSISFKSSKLNTPTDVDRFHFEVVDINGSTLVTTATIPVASSNDSGIEIECREEANSMIEVVTVSG